ncbi:chalcone isomerase family protein [Agaribacterium haliotis]|uniref:chalcone isomerase family protein n=1 Tax=Agaribacterium haliotis TaxID=2013869 RepID=UPI0013046D89|nr:chalcone isomerase family protein [Agaribacterium haliotis]
MTIVICSNAAQLAASSFSTATPGSTPDNALGSDTSNLQNSPPSNSPSKNVINSSINNAGIMLAKAPATQPSTNNSTVNSAPNLPAQKTEHHALDGLVLQGQGTMQWMNIRLYDAEYYISDKQQPRAAPVALSIDYHKNIAAKRLVKATQKQWRKLGLKHKQQQHWLKQLPTLWPDLSAGDRLTCIVNSDGSTDFFHNGQWLGRINDRDFGPQFLDIWLHQNSSERELRAQLLGLNR